MKLGIRSKMVLLLALVALLPLLAAVAVIALELTHTRTRTVGEGLQSMAHSEALVREVSLAKDLDRLLLLMEEPEVGQSVADAAELFESQRQELDRQWQVMPLEDPRMNRVLHNPAAEVLDRFEHADPRVKEIMITDRFGQLVAATGRTSDYYQADEEWWVRTFNRGSGSVVVPAVSYDQSAKTWSIDLCVPVVSGGKVVGVAKAVLDITQWMRIEVGGKAGLISEEYKMLLLDEEGNIVFQNGSVPFSGRITHPEAFAGPDATGWRREADELQAYAPIHLGGRIGGFGVSARRMTLLLYLPRSVIMQPIYVLTLQTGGAGLVVVLVLFVLGLVLIDRSLTRRILWLQQGAHEVAKGDLSMRIRLDRPGGRILGRDEIDQLAAEFNAMIQQVQRSTAELQSANELKSNFIRVAGHELRTPISYILGMARLLKDSTDATRLSFAVQSMGAKSRRLNEIVQAMFKLMPEGFHGEGMNYSRVHVSELLEEIYIDLFPFIEQRNQRLLIELVDRLPDLKADRDKLRDIVENLVINAIKFTPDGGVVRVRCSLQLGDRVMISVQDQGPGIPESELPRLFQPFYSGSTTDVMTHSTGEVGFQKRGMGLGLAIVKHFAQLHYGKVHVTSTGTGATFSVTIPVEPPPGPEKVTWPRPEPIER